MNEMADSLIGQLEWTGAVVGLVAWSNFPKK